MQQPGSWATQTAVLLCCLGSPSPQKMAQADAGAHTLGPCRLVELLNRLAWAAVAQRRQEVGGGPQRKGAVLSSHIPQVGAVQLQNVEPGP